LVNGRTGTVAGSLAGSVPTLGSDDAASCAKRATQLGAYCSVNGNEVQLSTGIGHYCLLTSGLVSSCVYVDEANCTRDARQQGGACVKSETSPDSPAADPFHNIRPPMAGN
jgi:hypothetical protein